MKFLVVISICFAAYLWFPLPRKKLPEQTADVKETDVESEPEWKAASNSEIHRALEVIRLCVSSGMTVSDALEYAQKYAPPAAARELERGLNQFRVGFPLPRGLTEIADENPRWRSISDILITSLNTGSPIGDQLADVEFLIQSAMDTEKLKRIKSVAVKSVLPLGLCFLPAFILLGVVPVIAGLISGINK